MRQRVLAVLILAVALLPLAGLGAWFHGSRQLAAHRDRIERGFAAERRRIAEVRHPALTGPALGGNAAVAYRELIDGLELTGAEAAAIRDAVDAGSGVALDDTVLGALGRHRARLAGLATAVRHVHVDWGLPLDDAYVTPLPPLFPARMLGNLVVLDGHRRRRAGDAGGALDRYGQALRYGIDFGAENVPALNVLGIGIAGMAVDAIGDLAGELDPELRRRAAHLLERSAPHLPGLRHGIRGELLLLRQRLAGDAVLEAWTASSPWGTAAAAVLPDPWLVAFAMRRLEVLLDDAERSAALADPIERRRASATVDARLRAAFGPALRSVRPVLELTRVADELRARHAAALGRLRAPPPGVRGL